MDKTGWFVAVVLFVLLIFRDVAKKWVTAAIEGLGQAVFRRMASSRFMRSRALAKYRAAILRRYSEAAVPFMDEKLPSMCR